MIQLGGGDVMTLQYRVQRHCGKIPDRCRLQIVFALFALAFVFSLPANSLAVGDAHPLRLFKAEAEFDDVKFDLENAIVNAGLKIIYQGNIAEMLERTAGEVGTKGKVYDNAEFFTFCSAPNSHATMNADPRNIGYCPYLLYVYSLAGEKDITYVGYRRPLIVGAESSKAALMALDKLLEGLVKEAVE